MNHKQTRVHFSPLVLLLSLGACATAASSSQAPSASALFEQGVAAHQASDSTRAEQYLSAALEAGVPEERVLPPLLQTCLASDRYDTALHYARRRLLRHPEDWYLRYLVANLHLATGQPERARLETERLIEERPQAADPHYLMALVTSDLPRGRNQTVQSLHRYLAIAPHGPHAADAKRMLRRLTSKQERT